MHYYLSINLNRKGIYITKRRLSDATELDY